MGQGPNTTFMSSLTKHDFYQLLNNQKIGTFFCSKPVILETVREVFKVNVQVLHLICQVQKLAEHSPIVKNPII